VPDNRSTLLVSLLFVQMLNTVMSMSMKVIAKRGMANL